MAKAKRAKRAKKTTRKARGTSKGKSVVSKSAITFRLTPAEVKRAQQCLERSGEIRYTFKNIKVSKLPQVLDDGKLID